MRTLQDRLNAIREAFAQKAPPAAKEIMGQATEALRNSGILDGLPKVGDAFPPFALADTQGETLRSEDLLAKGPLIVTIYRGVW
ncbi:MAG: hypothetical protein AAF368_14190 [Planctomycetota bacterium]